MKKQIFAQLAALILFIPLGHASLSSRLRQSLEERDQIKEVNILQKARTQVPDITQLVNTPVRGEMPIETAARLNLKSSAMRLYVLGANLHHTNGGGWTPLHVAARYNSVDVASFLVKNAKRYPNDEISAKGMIEAKDHDGWRPIHVAAYYGSHRVIDFILKQGANFQAKTTSHGRRTALRIARRHGWHRSAKVITDFVKRRRRQKPRCKKLSLSIYPCPK